MNVSPSNKVSAASLYKADPLHALLSLNSLDLMLALSASTYIAPPNPSSDAEGSFPLPLYERIVLAELL